MNGDYTYIVENLGAPIYYDCFGCPQYKLRYYHVKKAAAFTHKNPDGSKGKVELDGWDGFMEYMRVCICQGCRKCFTVQCTHPIYTAHQVCTDHYGDPPYHDCIGDSMNVDDTRQMTDNEVVEMLNRALDYIDDKRIIRLIKNRIKDYSPSKVKK